MSKRRNNRRTGFSLMEILLVAALIALLLGLLLPVIGMIRDAAKTTVCLSSHRQLVMGVMGYAADVQGEVPAVRGMSKNGNWISAITPYLREGIQTDATSVATNWKHDVAYGCPLFIRDRVRQEYAGIGFFYNGIGMNGWLMAEGDASDPRQRRHTYIGAETNIPRFSTQPASIIRTAQITHATNRIILIDNNEDWTGNAGFSGLPAGDPAENICIWGGSSRHHGRTIAAFVDGHVATITNGWPSQASAGIQDPAHCP